MKLRHGMRFLLIERGETWELHRQTLDGRWVCRISGPSCNHPNCPTKQFREFTENEIWDNIIIDPTNHQGKWLGQMEVEILAALNSRLRHLNSVQKRSLLLAVRGHIDKMLGLSQ